MLRRRARSSSDSAVVTPGRLPSSMSARRIQFRRQDSEIPKSRAICAIEVSPRRATATTSWRNSFGWAAGMSISFQ